MKTQGTDVEKDQAQIELKEKYPEEVLKAIEAGDTVLRLMDENDRPYYFKRPKPMDINRFLGTSSKGKLAVAVRNLVFEMAIYPAAEDLKNELKEKPGLVVAWNNALQTNIGLNEDFTVKKL